MHTHTAILIEKLREECRDAMAYAKLASEIKGDGEEWLSKKLRMMAYEEYTHAYTIRRGLLMNDVTIDAETCRLFKEAEEIAGN